MDDRKGAKREEEEDFVSPFDGLQKSKVFNQAIELFNQKPPIDARKCCNTLTELLWLISLGEKFNGTTQHGSTEATDLFFGVTKLFESNDAQLRRMVYLVIKELNQDQSKAFIVINSLEQDINARIDLSKANAIRVLSQVIDATALEQPHTQRFLQTAIVSQNPFVASSSLLAGIRLFGLSPESVRKWVNKIMDAMQNSPHNMVQFHALHLLYMIKRHDQRSVMKVVSSLSVRPPESPLAHCLLIRISFSVIGTNPPKTLIDFIEKSTRNKSSMVCYEAARALCNIRSGDVDITPAIIALQDMLQSHQPTHRFAAVRMLSQVVERSPSHVAKCINQLESLAKDGNRNIATLATITILKTGVEDSVDHLVNTVNEFMSDISDELKTDLVGAIRTQCLKFPAKHRRFLNFLSDILREEGGYTYKKSIVDSMLEIMERVDAAREPGLEHLCEFIEDCEFPQLSIRILHLLGDSGPSTSDPTKYIRFIFNRVILELPCVRCAAVSALAKFGADVPSMTASILVLLKRTRDTDSDDEVRDRATFYIQILEDKEIAKSEGEASKILSLREFATLNLANLEYSLTTYLADPPDETFDLEKHLVQAAPDPAAEAVAAAEDTSIYKTTVQAVEENQYNQAREQFAELREIGELFMSTEPFSLTEEESEYLVHVVKHIHQNHIVFQFNVENTLDDQLLCDVSVELTYPEGLEQEELQINAKVLKVNQVGQTYLLCSRDEDCRAAEMEATLMFTVKDAHSEAPEFEEGYKDEWPLDIVKLEEKDFIKGKSDINQRQFSDMFSNWEENESMMKKATMKLDTIKEAVDYVMKLLGLAAIEGTDNVPEEKTAHVLQLYGEFITGEAIVATCHFKKKGDGNGNGNIRFKVSVRSPDPELSQMVKNLIC